MKTGVGGSEAALICGAEYPSGSNSEVKRAQEMNRKLLLSLWLFKRSSLHFLLTLFHFSHLYLNACFKWSPLLITV